jgi:hypothetical protein
MNRNRLSADRLLLNGPLGVFEIFGAACGDASLYIFLAASRWPGAEKMIARRGPQ